MFSKTSLFASQSDEGFYLHLSGQTAKCISGYKLAFDWLEAHFQKNSQCSRFYGLNCSIIAKKNKEHYDYNYE